MSVCTPFSSPLVIAIKLAHFSWVILYFMNMKIQKILNGLLTNAVCFESLLFEMRDMTLFKLNSVTVWLLNNSLFPLKSFHLGLCSMILHTWSPVIRPNRTQIVEWLNCDDTFIENIISNAICIPRPADNLIFIDYTHLSMLAKTRTEYKNIVAIASSQINATKITMVKCALFIARSTTTILLAKTCGSPKTKVCGQDNSSGSVLDIDR